MTNINDVIKRLEDKACGEAKRFNTMSIGIGKWKPENFQEWHDAQAIKRNKC